MVDPARTDEGRQPAPGSIVGSGPSHSGEADQQPPAIPAVEHGDAEPVAEEAPKGFGLPYTVHGFRSSFRDWGAEQTTFPRELLEKALAHTIRDKAEAAYQRGDLLEKRRELMQAWADELADRL